MKSDKKLEKEEKKIIIDLNSEEVVNFKGNLGVDDGFLLLEILADITKQINGHLKKVVMASYVHLASKVKLECEIQDSEDGELKISNEKFAKMVEDILK